MDFDKVDCSQLLDYIQIENDAIIAGIHDEHWILEEVRQLDQNENDGVDDEDNDATIRIGNKDEITQSTANIQTAILLISNVLDEIQHSLYRIDFFL